MNKDNANDQSRLIERLKQGDSEAFAELVEQYSNAIYRIALRFTSESQDAEDVLQEVFIRVFRHLDQFRNESSLSTWIYRIATNECLRLLNSRKEEVISAEDVQEEPEVEPLLGTDIEI